MSELTNQILIEEAKLETNKSPTEIVNILYNLIHLKNKVGRIDQNYIDIKKFVDNYFEVLKISNYGYDSINYSKFEKLLKFLPHKEQYEILRYSISVSTRELPEYNKDWFVARKHQAEIGKILNDKIFTQYPKAFFLYTGLSTGRLLVALTVFFVLVTAILLPAKFEKFAVFDVKYHNYNSNFLVNHFLNILTLFADLDNNLKIEPLNWWALILIIIAKVSFVLLIVNYIYRKIIDKISIK